MSAWGNPSNLPPGCTDHDIERNAGTYADCSNCGREWEAEKLDENDRCPRCQNEDDTREDR